MPQVMTKAPNIQAEDVPLVNLELGLVLLKDFAVFSSQVGGPAVKQGRVK